MPERANSGSVTVPLMAFLRKLGEEVPGQEARKPVQKPASGTAEGSFSNWKFPLLPASWSLAL